MTESEISDGSRFRFFDQKPPLPNIVDEVVEGLSAAPKWLSPKYFYDAEGSRLFEAITELPEYYLTRTEIGILDTHRRDIARAVGERTCLVEFGSGSSTKIRILLSSCRPAAYVPVDISKAHLLESAERIYRDYPDLAVYPTSADYTHTFALPEAVRGLPVVAFFPGSSVGNFLPAQAQEFLGEVAAVVGRGGALLIGVDRKKDPAVLNAAYDDAAGVTRAFNLNVLAHLNSAVGTNFDVDAFDHRAQYNEALGRVEMYLVSTKAQQVTIDGRTFELADGEAIHTESSYKYHPEEFIALASAAGFDCEAHWEDAREYFMVLLLRAR